jgi:hypothetical protein
MMLHFLRRMSFSERNRCRDNACLVDLYRERVDELCDYGVASGVHPGCTPSEDIK